MHNTLWVNILPFYWTLDFLLYFASITDSAIANISVHIFFNFWERSFTDISKVKLLVQRCEQFKRNIPITSHSYIEFEYILNLWSSIVVKYPAIFYFKVYIYVLLGILCRQYEFMLLYHPCLYFLSLCNSNHFFLSGQN